MRINSLLAALALAACSPQPATAPPVATQEEAAPAAVLQDPNLATIGAPQANARVTSPLRVTGIAPANWYFENQFPVSLVDARGQVIAQGPAHPEVNWTENADPKAFSAEITFSVTTETAAILVLQEDMPGEDATPREVRIPVVLSPS